MADNSKAQESWNMATETLKRLSRCLDMFTFYMQTGDLPNAFNSYLSLELNLDCFLDEEEKNTLKTTLSKMPQRWKSPDGRVLRRCYGPAYATLSQVYKVCLNYMKSKGLLMPKPTDPRAAVLNT